MPITKTSEILGGDPRLDGRRISVLHVADLVLGGQRVEDVADQLGITLAEVHEAMAYYYNHPEEMEELRRKDEELQDELRERSNAPTKTTQ